MVRGKVNCHDGDSGHGGEDGSQHGHDEPGGPIGGLWRGLGDAHRADEGVRDEEEKLHGSFTTNLERW